MPVIRIAAIAALMLQAARLIFVLAAGSPLERAVIFPGVYAAIELAPLAILLSTPAGHRPGRLRSTGFWLLLFAVACMSLAWVCAPNSVSHYPRVELRNIVGTEAFVIAYLGMIGGAALVALSLLLQLGRSLPPRRST